MPIRRLSITLVALSSALILVACGSSSKPLASGGSNGSTSFLHFSECMRSHGLPSFPDPRPGGHGINLVVGSGLNPQSPAFQSAQQSCKHLLPGGGPPATLPESVRLSLLKHAECMRAHGVPNYPDPTFQKGGGVESFLGPAVSPSSPAFQNAAKVCGGHG